MPNTPKQPAKFTAADREAAILKLQEIETDLAPHLRSLTIEERKKTLNMRDKSSPFVKKTIQYAKEFSEVMPSVIDIEQMERDYEKVQEMDYVIRKTEKILDGMKDGRLIAANDTYYTALKVYQIFRSVGDLELPGITAALEELGKRFSGQGRIGNAIDRRFEGIDQPQSGESVDVPNHNGNGVALDASVEH